jgi:rubrerythrin
MSANRKESELEIVTTMEFKGSKTEKNVLAAFAGESQARNRYSFFASVAKKEGFEQVGAIFAQTAEEEREHAKLFFRLLKGGDAEITAAYPAGMIGTTKQNLKAAAAGEKMEWGTLYPAFAKAAEDEGFADIARLFKQIAKVETHHEKRYATLLANVERGEVFTKDVPSKWYCRNCGYVIDGKSAPMKCPVCDHPQAHFELLCENY